MDKHFSESEEHFRIEESVLFHYFASLLVRNTSPLDKRTSLDIFILGGLKWESALDTQTGS